MVIVSSLRYSNDEKNKNSKEGSFYFFSDPFNKYQKPLKKCLFKKWHIPIETFMDMPPILYDRNGASLVETSTVRRVLPEVSVELTIIRLAVFMANLETRRPCQ